MKGAMTVLAQDSAITISANLIDCRHKTLSSQILHVFNCTNSISYPDVRALVSCPKLDSHLDPAFLTGEETSHRPLHSFHIGHVARDVLNSQLKQKEEKI